MSDQLIQILLPIMILFGGGIVVLLLGLIKSPNTRELPGVAAMLTILIAFLSILYKQGCLTCTPVFMLSNDGSVQTSTLGMYISLIVLAVAGLLALISWDPDKFNAGLNATTSIAGEFYSMMLFSIAGLLLVVVSNNLLILFVGLELVSIPTYIMIALSGKGKSREAALKYFYLGAMATGLMAYGFAQMYGLVGSLRFEAIEILWTDYADSSVIIAFSLAIVGLCFKVAVVPMHFYVADVYQGAASPVSAFLAFIPKFAGFYGLFIVLRLIGFPESLVRMGDISILTSERIGVLLWILAALTMTAGNVLALMQRNVKRILAYSSIAHSGYILLAVMVGNFAYGSAIAAMIFYLMVYGIATMGIFTIIALLRKDGGEAEELSDLAGLNRKHPLLAATLAICVFSLVGMPLTGGFSGKFMVFSSLVNTNIIQNNIILLIVALINAAIASAYYLRIVAAAYITEGTLRAEFTGRLPQLVGLAMAVILTIVLGVMPSKVSTALETASSIQRNKAEYTTVSFEQPQSSCTVECTKCMMDEE